MTAPDDEILTTTFGPIEYVMTEDERRFRELMRPQLPVAVGQGGEGFLPTRGTAKSAGVDLYAAISTPRWLAPNAVHDIPTGVRTALPQGTVGLLCGRSSLRRSLVVAQGIGVIDEDYAGEIIVALHNISDQSQLVEPGERIAQLLVMPVLYPVVTPIDPDKLYHIHQTRGSERAGGFGSTGRF